MCPPPPPHTHKENNQQGKNCAGVRGHQCPEASALMSQRRGLELVFVGKK